MGSTPTVDESAKFHSMLHKTKLDLNDDDSRAREIFDYDAGETATTTKKIDRKDYDPFGLARLIKKNGCLLCRVMEHLPQNQKVGKSRSLRSRRTSSGPCRGQVPKSIYVNSVSDDANGVKSVVGPQQERTFKTKNLMLNSRVRMRRDAGDRRRKRLYSKAGRYFLQIQPKGKVSGTLNSRSPLGIMKMHTVAVGKIRIQSEATGQYLCMKKYGKLYGTYVYDPLKCVFHERLTANMHTTYFLQFGGRRSYVGLSKRGKPKRGNKINEMDVASHFLPLDIK